MTVGIIVAYLALVLVIGLLGRRLAQSAGEEFFVASRTIGPFVLLMTLFGTHMTSFALLGSSAESYRVGIGVFTLMASSSALMVPMVFFFVGTRVWALGKRHGLLTQVQFLRARFEADYLGLAMFVVLVALLIPYLLIGVMGAGITFRQIAAAGGTDVPSWMGGALVSLVVLVYVSFGGMRGTAWVNTFQTCLFMLLGGATAIFIVNRMGGLGESMARLAQEYPELVVRGERIAPVRALTYTFVPLSVGMFPHIFGHWLSARRVATFRAPVIFYPLCIAAVWLPMVVLGVLGRLDVPGLEGPAANSILIQLIGIYAPGLLAGLLGAGVFAAIMSSLDSQSLSLGTMFTQDIARHYGLGNQMSEARQVFVGRLFVASVLVVTFLLSLVADSSIFGLSVWSFSGFAALLPILLAALYWRRASALGAWASLVTVAVLFAYFFARGFGNPDYSVLGTGVMPVAVMFLASALAMMLGSFLGSPPSAETVDSFFVDLDVPHESGASS